jgi:hypothetical protein
VSAAPDLRILRAALEKRFGSALVPAPGGAPDRAVPGFRTGIAAIDRLLPGGVPRRAVTHWAGEVTAGRTAALRRLVGAALRETRVAVVDAALTLDAGDWCGADDGPLAGLWVARPPAAGRAAEGAWAAEALLRSGAFGLVVLDGGAPAPAEVHRLRALARETDAAVLVSTPAGGGAAGWRADLRLEFRRAPRAAPGLRAGARYRRPAAVRLEKGSGGENGEREMELVHEPPDRLRALAFAPDRRPRARA